MHQMRSKRRSGRPCAKERAVLREYEQRISELPIKFGRTLVSWPILPQGKQASASQRSAHPVMCSLPGVELESADTHFDFL
jgi:hypothetical protein